VQFFLAKLSSLVCSIDSLHPISFPAFPVTKLIIRQPQAGETASADSPAKLLLRDSCESSVPRDPFSQLLPTGVIAINTQALWFSGLHLGTQLVALDLGCSWDQKKGATAFTNARGQEEVRGCVKLLVI
jgi:hypothetical protein